MKSMKNLLAFVLGTMLLICCGKTSAESVFMPYLQESAALYKADMDSLASFAEKLYVNTAGRDCDKDPIYRLTVKNIDNTKKFLNYECPVVVWTSEQDSVVVLPGNTKKIDINTSPTDEWGE